MDGVQSHRPAVKTAARVLVPSLLAFLAACGLVSSRVGTEVSESEAWAVKAGVENNFDEAWSIAISALSTASGGEEPFLTRHSCSEFTTREVSISVTGSFTVRSTSSRSVERAIRRSWEHAGWTVRRYEEPDETIYDTGQEGVRGYVGSLRVGSDRDASGRHVVRVSIASESACLRLPESLGREAWPTEVDDS